MHRSQITKHKTQNTKQSYIIRLLIDAEVECLIKIIEQVLPEGSNDWIHVREQHMLFYPREAQMCDSLKCKFQGFYNSKKPTSNPVSVMNA